MPITNNDSLSPFQICYVPIELLVSTEEEKKADSSDDEDGGSNLKEVSFNILLIYETRRAVASRSRQSEME